MPIRKGKQAPEPAPVRTPNAIVAAAQRIVPGLWNEMRIPTQAWQREGWRQFDINGELAFGANWLGAALSRCRLQAVDLDATGAVIGPTSNEEVIALVRGLAGSPAKQTQLLHSFGPQMTVAGDCYLVATVGEDNTFDKWTLYSTEEVTQGISPDEINVNIGDGKIITYSTKTSLVMRVYRPHPRRSYEAYSPTRSALPVLREMEQLTKHIFATIDSRLAGAGILLLPSELDFPSPEGEINAGESPFIALLSEAMMTSIKDRGDARAVVPIVAQGPREAIGAAQWLTSPASELTSVVADLRDRAIRRLAIDLDMPPEALLGTGDSNHWNGWQIEESGIKLHITPIMDLICSALTEGYLVPAMIAAGIDITKFAIWFDPSDLVLRPNRAQDAKDLYDKGVISAETLRRECGFTEFDAPADKELILQELYRLIGAAPRAGEALLPVIMGLLELEKYGVTPEQIQQVINSSGVDGTPAKPAGPAAPNADATAPPAAGQNGNQG